MLKSWFATTEIWTFSPKPRFSANDRQHTIKIANPLVNMPPKPELTSDQRSQVIFQLFLLAKDGSEPPKLKRGALTSVANNFDVKPKTV
jgi:hypothetical protein